jgi:DedD protein
MDTRIKERLVGAIALVAVVVIVVPELLTGQRTPAVAAQSPGSVPTHTVTINLQKPEPALGSAPAAPQVLPAVPVDGASAGSGSAAAESRMSPATPEATPAIESPLGPDTEPPGPAASAAPVALPAAAAARAPAPAPSPAPPRPSAVTHAGEAWVVQLGSFQSRDNAERLVTGLRTKGYSAFVSEFRGSGRVLFRVRVGPEQDRARADAIAARLARDGHRGSVAPEG